MPQSDLDRLRELRGNLAPPSGEVTDLQKLRLILGSVQENTPDALGVAAEQFGTKLLGTGLDLAQSIPNALLFSGSEALTGRPALDFQASDVIGGLGGPTAQQQEERAIAQPAAAATGEGLADILTVFGGRRAGTKGLENLPALRGLGPATKAGGLEAAIEAAKPGARRFALEITNKVADATKGLAQRTAQTAGEGAAFAALGDDEDLTTGALAGAGLELAAAPGRSVLGLIRKHGVLKAVGTAALAAIAIPAFIPGGSDRVLDSITEAGDEINLAIALGLASTGATGRLPKKGLIAKNFPELADLATSLPRGALTQVIASFAAAPDEVEPVLQRFSGDPAQFGEFADDLTRAMISPEKGALKDTIESLMGNPAFREIMRRPTLDQFGPLGG